MWKPEVSQEQSEQRKGRGWVHPLLAWLLSGFGSRGRRDGRGLGWREGFSPLRPICRNGGTFLGNGNNKLGTFCIQRAMAYWELIFVSGAQKWGPSRISKFGIYQNVPTADTGESMYCQESPDRIRENKADHAEYRHLRTVRRCAAPCTWSKQGPKRKQASLPGKPSESTVQGALCVQCSTK